MLSAGMSEPWYYKAQREAGEKVEALLRLPISEDNQTIDCETEFDPWALFPAVYGSYSSDFDETALQVLEAIQLSNEDRHDEIDWKREGLAHHMIREMLSTAELCEYGTSPRVCFATSNFRPLVGKLIEKWKAYYEMQWGQPYVA